MTKIHIDEKMERTEERKWGARFEYVRVWEAVVFAAFSPGLPIIEVEGLRIIVTQYIYIRYGVSFRYFSYSKSSVRFSERCFLFCFALVAAVCFRAAGLS